MAGLADLLTVEEAARVIRVGRTKAYAMAREWRDTGGKSGLPVIDFGNVLRVPRCQLEAMVGVPLTVDRGASTTSAAGPEGAGPPAPIGSPVGTSPSPLHKAQPAHLVGLLGPVPVDDMGEERWASRAGRIEAYREQWAVAPDKLRTSPADGVQFREWLAAVHIPDQFDRLQAQAIERAHDRGPERGFSIEL